jgi:hypothetical protein
MATINLRLRGVTPMQGVMAALAAYPLGMIGYELAVKHAPLTPSLAALAVAVAGLPWASLALARATYRAKCDEIAVHVRGEALPYRTITDVRVERTPRRVTLRLRRGETVELQLVLWDAFAGRLQPLDELARRLAAHGHPIPEEDA